MRGNLMAKSGDLICNYRLIKKMSSSEKSTVVFFAQDRQTENYVALKIFDTQNQIALEHFVTEVEILHRLKHPNIIRIINSGQLQNTAYIVLEFLEGIHLNRITPKNTGLPYKTIWPFIEQISLGLIHMHEEKIAHLDLKPSNILLTHQENQTPLIKIIDFDIARDVDTAWSHSEKSWGTPGYIAPERILNESKPDIRSDIYAFGAIIAFLLTGQKPFTGEADKEILTKQLNQSPDVINNSYLGKSSELQKIVLQAMEKNPADRFQNVSEMVAGLNANALASK
jgi:eukaryotic-like serine/threonine-protein kinase